MWVSELELRDFRNHAHTSLTLSPGITVFWGPNGQGKTNLIEALGYLAYLSSHRVSSDRALVRTGSDSAIVRVVVSHQSRSVELACEIRAAGANRAKINSQPAKLSELSGWLKVVLFTPEDLSIIRGEPGVRRRYLDDAVMALKPRMHNVYMEYDKVVKQRNALLKTARGERSSKVIDTLHTWSEPLLTLAADISRERRALVRQLVPKCEEAYRLISGGHAVDLLIDSPVSQAEDDQLEEAYRRELDRRQRDELDRAMTLVGPHRDDLTISLNSMPGRTHSSHGEAWSLALALRLGLAEVFRERSSSGDPVIILDDVFAELDATRRTRLQQLVSGFEQVLVTAAVSEDIPDNFATHTFHVERGQVMTGETQSPRNAES